MLRQRWIIGSTIVLFSCIIISHSATSSNEEKNLFVAMFNNLKNGAINLLNDVLNLKNEILDKLDKSSLFCTARILDPEWLTGINLSNFVSDMQEAVIRGDNENLRRSIGKLFDVQRIVDEIKEGKVTKVTCVACRFVLRIAQFLMFIGQSDKQIADLTTNLCSVLGSFFGANEPSVCSGIMDSMGLDAIYAIRHADMSPAQLCQQFFGEECICGYDKKHDWPLNLPKKTKQSNPIKPPLNNAPKLKVLQITDIHYDPYYQEGSESDCNFIMCCRESSSSAKTPKSAAGKWGDYRKCDSPLNLIENALQHIADTHKDIDYILWTGDIPPHDYWNQSVQGNIDNLKITTGLIAKYFGNITVLPAVGNHESFPMDSFVTPNLKPGRNMKFLYDELVVQWSRWLPASALETVRKGGFYSYLVKPGLRVISVNGNYCGRHNFLLMINSTDPNNQLAWLVRELKNAERIGEKVHIINHVPPGQFDCMRTWSHHYYNIINRFEDTITAQFYGHTHYDEFEVFYDTSDFKRPVNVAYIAPSITTWKDCNPAYRIYYVDGDHPETTRTVVDFETWAMKLDEANKNGKPQWYKSYNAKSTYDMKSLLPKDWDNLIQRMAENRTLFDIYHGNYYRHTPTMPKCDNNCRRDLLCDLRSARSHDKKNLCRNL